MRRFNANQYVALEMYLRRPKLGDFGMMVVRVRVAIKVLDRLYARVEHRIPERDFPAFCERQLNQMVLDQRPHPLDEELRDLLHAWRRRETSAECYFRAVKYQSMRIVNRVRYGGRKG